MTVLFRLIFAYLEINLFLMFHLLFDDRVKLEQDIFDPVADHLNVALHRHGLFAYLVKAVILNADAACESDHNAEDIPGSEHPGRGFLRFRFKHKTDHAGKDCSHKKDDNKIQKQFHDKWNFLQPHKDPPFSFSLLLLCHIIT